MFVVNRTKKVCKIAHYAKDDKDTFVRQDEYIITRVGAFLLCLLCQLEGYPWQVWREG